MAYTVAKGSRVQRKGVDVRTEAVLEFFGLHEELTSDPALSPIVALLQNAIADGWVDEAESNELANLISHIVNPLAALKTAWISPTENLF